MRMIDVSIASTTARIVHVHVSATSTPPRGMLLGATTRVLAPRAFKDTLHPRAPGRTPSRGRVLTPGNPFSPNPCMQAPCRSQTTGRPQTPGHWKRIRSSLVSGCPQIPGTPHTALDRQSPRGLSAQSLPRQTLLDVPQQLAKAASELGTSCQKRQLVTQELWIGSLPAFDVESPALQDKLCAALGIALPAHIEAWTGIPGGLNHGIWRVRHSTGPELILKVVRGAKRAPLELTEAEAFERMYSDYPDLVNDPLVAFPLKILRLRCAAGFVGKDVIVMERAPGKALAEVQAEWLHTGRGSQLLEVFRKVGAALGTLHNRYGGKQHGDMQSSNVYYDDVADVVTFIDLGGMTTGSATQDVDHFESSLRMAVAFFGKSHIEAWIAAFRQGFESQRRAAESVRLSSGSPPGRASKAVSIEVDTHPVVPGSVHLANLVDKAPLPPTREVGAEQVGAGQCKCLRMHSAASTAIGSTSDEETSSHRLPPWWTCMEAGDDAELCDGVPCCRRS